MWPVGVHLEFAGDADRDRLQIGVVDVSQNAYEDLEWLETLAPPRPKVTLQINESTPCQIKLLNT